MLHEIYKNREIQRMRTIYLIKIIWLWSCTRNVCTIRFVVRRRKDLFSFRIMPLQNILKGTKTSLTYPVKDPPMKTKSSPDRRTSSTDMHEVVVTLEDGPPWGFRLEGGSEFDEPLRIAKVRKRILTKIPLNFKMTLLPVGESNPGRGGESAES